MTSIQEKKSIRYLFWGGINTGFGYCISVGLYYWLTEVFYLIPIMIIANVISITFSFTTYRLFVFKSKGVWWHEYFRCYIVYGGSALIGILGMWILVVGLHIQFWIAQALLLIISVSISYIGHDRFTFKKGIK